MADRTMVDYTQKIKPYFEGIAPIEPITTAAHTHAVGDVFYLNGTKVKCTVAISVGDTIAIGTNVEEADDVESEIQALTNNLSDESETRAALGAHNLLPIMNLAELKTLNTTGTWTNNVYDLNGVTFTVNNDFTITASTGEGGATGLAELVFKSRGNKNFTLPEGKYIVSGCPAGGSNSKYFFKMNYTTPNNTAASLANNFGGDTDVEITSSMISSYYGIGANIGIMSGQILTTPITFNPMVRLATDSDPTYQPYAKTNRELTEDTNAIEPMLNVLGAKNLLQNTASSATVNGITFTVNSDGSVTANGTATADATLTIADGITINADAILSGCPTGGGTSTYFLAFEKKTNPWTRYAQDNGSGATITTRTTGDNIVYLRVRSGQTVSNLKFYPMIRPASIEDDTFVPYAMTNQELTEKLDALLTTSTVTLAISDGLSQTVTLTKPEGYNKCLGVVGLVSEGSTNAVPSLYQWNIVSNGTALTAKWLADAPTSGLVTFILLWIK